MVIGVFGPDCINEVTLKLWSRDCEMGGSVYQDTLLITKSWTELDKRPLKRPQNITSEKRYIGYWKRCIYYYFHTDLLDIHRRELLYEIQFTPEVINNIAVSLYIDNDVLEHESEFEENESGDEDIESSDDDEIRRQLRPGRQTADETTVDPLVDKFVTPSCHLFDATISKRRIFTKSSVTFQRCSQH